MLFPAHVWPGLYDGTVTQAFRRWKRPTVKAGGTLVTPAGVLAIDELSEISEDAITDEAAVAAGEVDRGAVLRQLRPGGTLYRIRFHRVGEDPRVALRERAVLDPGELEDLCRRLGRWPWAVPVLQQIADQPGVVSTTLAQEAGMERLQFKERVRRLKALGLTESLEVGYRLSARGRAVLEASVGS